ncbi:MAG TPA: phosphoribosylformylglycinamidine synthase subunit PurL, partial [Methanobacterium sp.]|nr:phosphoribosylformylglycinamidine synthase subunit PurL [Methanobacterium sp.]
GEVEFDENFKFNPLVNVVCAGLVKKEDIVRGIAPNVGDSFVLMGGRTGRDGIHGVTFASEELTTESELEDRPAVQVGDPFTKKMVLEACLEALDKIDVVGLKDLGGGGLTCCVSEMAAKGGNGAEVELTKIPLREEGMTPYEIMLSESQERMVFVVKPEDVDALMEIFEKYELPHAEIGKVTDNQSLIIKQEGKPIAEVKTCLLADPPVIQRDSCNPVEEDCGPSDEVEYQEVEEINPQEAILKLLSSTNIASKKWVYRQYDHEVQIRTAVKPGDDAAVLRIDDEKAIALTSDCNSIHTKLDPYHGGAGAVAEAFRNVVSMGAEPVCIVDCLNFGNPEKPYVFWQFKECIKGMSDIATKFNTPVISGNVSFYNETEGVTVNPSPVVGVAGLMDIKDIRTMDFKNEGDKIILIGETKAELDGSEYHKTINGVVQGKPPVVDMDAEFNSADSVLKLIREDGEGAVTAVHDLSSGGLAIAAAEMAISGGIGAVLETSKVIKDNNEMNLSHLLFSESNARFIITVKSENVEELLAKINAPAAIIGEVKGKKLIIDDTVDLSIDDLKESYYGVIEKFMA